MLQLNYSETIVIETDLYCPVCGTKLLLIEGVVTVCLGCPNCGAKIFYNKEELLDDAIIEFEDGETVFDWKGILQKLYAALCRSTEVNCLTG